ncbi:MAG TPA: tetratricopeptide repeat protein [Steroidobacteraceae bacterium]|nr:tetratricopeptide repeat protein [Steroidobacteraceae bacterium]
MKKTHLSLLALAVSMACAAAQAAPAECSKPDKAATDMSESAFGTLETAMDLMSKSKYPEAIEKLQKAVDSGTEYEKAVMNYNLGIAYSAKSDHPSAVKVFAKALSYNALPRSQSEQLQFNLGQLYIVVGQHDDGIKVLQNYVTTACGTVPADAHIFLANALSEKKRYQEALPQIDQAIAKSKTPKELWIQMKLAISYELKDFPACAQALVQLIGIVPAKADYWRQLSSLFYEMKKDTESVAVLALAERQGFVEKPNEIKNLYSVYMMLELPLKAGNLLQDAFDKKKLPADEKNLESIADAWINSRETVKAEATLKKLASISEKGEYYYKLGGMYGDEERWKDSKDMLEKALEKGNLKKPGEVWIRLAVAQHGLKNTPGAITALQKAVTFDDTRKQAGEWLRHLSSQFAAEQSEPEAASKKSAT